MVVISAAIDILKCYLRLVFLETLTIIIGMVNNFSKIRAAAVNELGGSDDFLGNDVGCKQNCFTHLFIFTYNITFFQNII